MSPTELDVDDSTLHYHLTELVDGLLVEKRQRTERGQGGRTPPLDRWSSAK